MLLTPTRQDQAFPRLRHTGPFPLLSFTKTQRAANQMSRRC